MEQSKSPADFQTAVLAQLALIEERARSPGENQTGNRPQLFYRGEPIILLANIVTGLDVSEKTIKRYRDAGKLEIFESIDGNIKFVRQSDLDAFLDIAFISSSHPDYTTVKKKPKTGGNAK